MFTSFQLSLADNTVLVFLEMLVLYKIILILIFILDFCINHIMFLLNKVRLETKKVWWEKVRWEKFWREKCLVGKVRWEKVTWEKCLVG